LQTIFRQREAPPSMQQECLMDNRIDRR